MICVEQLDYISLLRYIRDSASYIRVAHTLCEGESKAIKKRKLKIQKALSSLQIVCDGACVPPIAVLGSGGGLRAMVALMGTLTELGAQNLLDTIMYLCGVSGSTWCMSSLYRDPQWSSHVEEAETKMVETLSTDNFSFLKMRQKLHEATEDEKFSLTDVWAAGFVYKVVKEMDDRKLSKEEDVDMTNPYPIYAAVDKSQMKKEKHNKGRKYTKCDLFLFHSKIVPFCPGRWVSFTGEQCKCKRCSTLLCLLDLHENLYCGKDCKPILNSMKIIFKGTISHLYM
ncbi:PA24C phospholipase, partial [Atractosteus spatula]|nr:PA24C phospholipase [Atractosteus spatula]